MENNEQLVKARQCWMDQEVVLWQLDRNHQAYKDQFGIAHPAMVVTAEAIAKIIEVKLVPLVYGPGAGIGLMAQDQEGRCYTCNWEHCDDSGMSPYNLWGQSDRDGTFQQHLKDPFWWNAENYGFAIRDGQRAVPKGWQYCQEHDKIYGKVCAVCRLDQIYKERQQRYPNAAPGER